MSKILILAKRMEMGGTEVALLGLLDELVKHGHEVTLMLLNKQGPLLNRIPHGVVVCEIHISNNDIIERLAGKKIDYVKFSFAKKSIAKLLRLFLKQDGKKNNLYPFLLKHTIPLPGRYDILLDFHNYGYYLTAYGALKVNASKKAIWFHDANIFWSKQNDTYYKYYDRFFCVSNAVKKSVEISYPMYSKRTDVLYNIIDTNKIIEKSLEFIPDCFSKEFYNILTIGRLTLQKGYDYAIKIGEILKKNGYKFKWFIIGEGENRSQIENLINRKKLNDSFVLLGRKENPYPYIRKCDLYVQPSRYEGYGLTILEARCICKPIVASNIDAFKEQIINGENGVLCQLDPMEFASKISCLIDHPEIGERFVTNLKKEKVTFNNEYSKMENYIKD